MNADRAHGYTSVMRALRELDATLRADEQQTLREVADTRLFTTDAAEPAERALRDAERLLDALVDEARLTTCVADHIAYQLEVCGPAGSPAALRH